MRKIFVFFFFFLFSTISFARPLYDAASFISSGEGRELTWFIDVDATRTPIYSIPLVNMKAGEFIMVLSDFEITNDNRYTVGIGSQVILGDHPRDTYGIDEITDANMFNITKESHHGVPVKIGILKIKRDYDIVFVNVIAWAVSSSANKGDKVKVEQNYGRLSVIKFGMSKKQ